MTKHFFRQSVAHLVNKPIGACRQSHENAVRPGSPGTEVEYVVDDIIGVKNKSDRQRR